MPVAGRNFLTFLDLKGQTQPLSQFTGKPVQDDLFMDKDDETLGQKQPFLNVLLLKYIMKIKSRRQPAIFFLLSGSVFWYFFSQSSRIFQKKLLHGFSHLPGPYFFRL